MAAMRFAYTLSLSALTLASVACFEDPVADSSTDSPTDSSSTGDGDGDSGDCDGDSGGDGDGDGDSGDGDGDTGEGLCGNGQLDPGEECDDANNEPGDGCEADCTNGPGALVQASSWDGHGFDDQINDIAVDAQGEVIVVGDTFVTAEDQDAFVRKYAADGETLLWMEELDVGVEDTLKGVAVDSQGNVFVAGWMDEDVYFVRKYAPEGEVLWTDQMQEGRLAWDVEVDAEDNFIVAGAVYDFEGVWGWQLAGWKHAPDYSLLWTALDNGDASVDIAYGVTLDGEGNVYLVGVHNPPNRARFVRVNGASGETVSSTALELGNISSSALDVAVDADDAITIAAVGAGDGWLQRIQPGGQVTWTQQFDGGVGSDDLRAVAAAPDGSVIAAGFRTVNGTNTEAPVFAVDLAGDELWSVAFDGDGADAIYSLILHDDGYIYVGGHSDGPNGRDAWWAKLESGL